MKKLIFLIILTASFLIPVSFSFAQKRTIDSLLILLKSDKTDTNKVKHLNALGRALLYQNPDTAIILGNQALDIITPVSSSEFSSANKGAGIRELKVFRASTLVNLGVCYHIKADYNKALDYLFSALKIDEELNNKKEIKKIFGSLGNVYLNKAEYPKAIDYFLKSLKISEELGDKNAEAHQLGNIGNVYTNQSDYNKAIEYYFKAFKIAKELGDKTLISMNLGNIGNLYYYKADYLKALDYMFKSLKIAEELNDKTYQASILTNIGSIYCKKKDYPQALNYYFKALKINKEFGGMHVMAVDLENIGELYSKIGKFKESEQYLKKAIAIDDNTGAIDDLMDAESNISELYDTTRRYKEALVHYKKAMTLKDTIFSQENKKQLVRKEMNYEFDKKEAATKAENEKQQAVAAAESKKQKIIIWSVLAGLLLVILFAGFVFRSLRITRKQKSIIELQKNEVSLQKEIVEKQKEKITDSITYAQRIQRSILMEESEVQNYLPESFIYFQPKDIVSGDFYWFSKLEDKIIIAAVDCTGHGVPGAFMSMIGNTLLNQIVNEKRITKPSEILDYLNLGVYEALHQKKDGALSDDGMAIALCMIDYKNNEIQYAGAENPLYIVLDGQLEIIKANVHGIGGGGMIAKMRDPMKKEFTNHVIPIKRDMSIYLFSDGYMDQFGGQERKKFGTQKFKELLLNNEPLSMQQQKELIASAHAVWKGNAQQIDDILVIGIKI